MTEKPKIPYNSQMAFAIAAGRDADASRIMAEAMGEIVGKACGFAQLFDFSDLPFVVAGMRAAANILENSMDELGKKLAESVQKAFSVPASEAKASEPMEFTVTTEEAAQSLARAVEADKSASLPAETVIREMEKGRQGASDRKTVRERLKDVFPSSSYR